MDQQTLLLNLVIVALIVLSLGFFLRRFKQPYVIAYIIAGILIGSSGLRLVTDQNVVSNLGEIGIILFMFFVGMEICIPCIIARWRVAILGTIVQFALSIGIIILIGDLFKLSLVDLILIGFMISLSSTAIVIKILESKKEINTNLGQNIIGILVVQDIAVIPILILFNFIRGVPPTFTEIILPIIGGILILSLMIWIISKQTLRFKFLSKMQDDHETQVLFSLILCFGMAVFTSYFGLSAALGAFVAGFIVVSTQQTHWVHEALNSFRVVFFGLFFIYVGMLIDIKFIVENLTVILFTVLVVFILNTFINTFILRFDKTKWCESIYGGAMLAQIGEFSFILAAIGLSNGIINVFENQLILAVISITLLLSPLWVMLVSKIVHIDSKYIFETMHSEGFNKLKKKI